MEKISLKIAALYWLKLGLTSFGGPTGQISMMYEELVEKRKWIPEKKFLNALNFSMLLPCLLYTSPSPRDRQKSRMPSSA